MKDVRCQELFESREEDSLLFSRVFIPDYFYNTQTIRLGKKISVFSLCSVFRILNEEIFGKRVSQILNRLSEGAGKAQYGNCGEPRAARSLDYNSGGVGSHPQTATMFVPLATTHPHFLNSSLRSPGVLRAQLENHQFNPTSLAQFPILLMSFFQR